MNTLPLVVEVTGENFEQTVIESSGLRLVMVDFWAEWCQPCKQLFPILERLANEYAGAVLIGKLNIDEQTELAAEAGVRSVPAVMVFRNGMVVDQFLGLQPESAIRQVIEQHRFRESDAMMAEAREAWGKGNATDALALARQAVALDPDREDLRFDLARYLLINGGLDEALAGLEAMSPSFRDTPEWCALMAYTQLLEIRQDAVVRETLQHRLEADSEDTTTRYQLAAHAASDGDYETALQNLVVLVERNRAFGEDAGRNGMLALFVLLGEEHPLVVRFRDRLYRALH